MTETNDLAMILTAIFAGLVSLMSAITTAYVSIINARQKVLIKEVDKQTETLGQQDKEIAKVHTLVNNASERQDEKANRQEGYIKDLTAALTSHGTDVPPQNGGAHVQQVEIVTEKGPVQVEHIEKPKDNPEPGKENK